MKGNKGTQKKKMNRAGGRRKRRTHKDHKGQNQSEEGDGRTQGGR